MLKGVKLLAQQHKMDPKALDDRLAAARNEYKKNMQRNTGIPRKKDVKKALEPIAKQAMELHQRLNNLDNLIQQGLDYLPQHDLSAIDKRLGAISLEGTDSILSNLSIELPHIADRASDVINGWHMKKLPDTARNMTILRITQAWKQLTNKPATYSTDTNKKSSDNPANHAPKYYNGNRRGEFLDFLTTACGIVGVKDRSDRPISPSAAVRHFVKLKEKHPRML